MGSTHQAVSRVESVNVDCITSYHNRLNRAGTPSGVAGPQLETVLLVNAYADLRIRLDVAGDIVGGAKGVDVHGCVLSRTKVSKVIVRHPLRAVPLGGLYGEPNAQ